MGIGIHGLLGIGDSGGRGLFSPWDENVIPRK